MGSKKGYHVNGRAAGSWTAVRVSGDTAAKLRMLREVWTENADRITQAPLGSEETRSGNESKCDAIGLDQVIRRLIALWEDHLERSRKSGKAGRDGD